VVPVERVPQHVIPFSNLNALIPSPLSSRRYSLRNPLNEAYNRIAWRYSCEFQLEVAMQEYFDCKMIKM